MRVRRAVPDDLVELLDMYETVAAERIHIGGEAPVDRERRRTAWLDTMDPETPGTSLVATVDGEIAGQLGLTGAGRMQLGMWVAQEWRGKGVGSALVRAALEHARANGAYKVSLEVWPHNAAAIALYEKFGFEREGYLRKHWRRRNGELWDSVVMGLVLDD
ncbi:MAG TPA: GNAT family N-acetyltransferase [Actinomycetota bacterium]|nr:GNAT family N-acetyltransferase [Actinomycetota bacterium]